jgi:hypothetical protein
MCRHCHQPRYPPPYNRIDKVHKHMYVRRIHSIRAKNARTNIKTMKRVQHVGPRPSAVPQWRGTSTNGLIDTGGPSANCREPKYWYARGDMHPC